MLARMEGSRKHGSYGYHLKISRGSKFIIQNIDLMHIERRAVLLFFPRGRLISMCNPLKNTSDRKKIEHHFFKVKEGLSFFYPFLNRQLTLPVLPGIFRCTYPNCRPYSFQ